jgi:CRISP-associated protein Cas1
MSTIYLTEQDVIVEIKHNYVKVFCEKQQRISIPIRNVSQFIIFGNIHLPKEVIRTIYSHQIPALYFTQQYEHLGRLENPSKSQPKYLSHQRRRARDIEFNLANAESMSWAKIHNQHIFLQGWTQHHANYATERALDYLTLLMDHLSAANSIDELREYNEEADNVYHYAIASLLNFYNPCPRANVKQISGLLNLGYQLLHQYIYTLLNTAELHPDYGILHNSSHHELPLAWDFAAEFRAPIVDDLVLNFARNLPNSNGNGNGKKHSLTLLQSFLQHWEAKLRTFILHPYAGEISYRQCMDLQVREYLACLLGDVEFYRPLALKFHPESEVKSKKLKVKREGEKEINKDLLFAADNNSTQNTLQFVSFL